MIDVHSHILPGVDDGSASMKESLQMLSIARRQGITDVEKFVQNPELVYKMSCNAQNTMNKYSWKKYEKKIACFYKNQII